MFTKKKKDNILHGSIYIIFLKWQIWRSDKWLPGVREEERKEVTVAKKGNTKQSCVDGTVLYPNSGVITYTCDKTA